MATIYRSKTGPKIHMHCGMGREKVALVGCLRDKASVYLVVEAVLMEFKGLNARNGARREDRFIPAVSG